MDLKVSVSESLRPSLDTPPLKGAVLRDGEWVIETTLIPDAIASTEHQVTVSGDGVFVMPYDDYVG